MLTKKYLELVAPLVAVAANNGYVARAADNSPLATLVHATNTSLVGQPVGVSLAEEDQSLRIEALVENLHDATQARMGLSSIELSPHSQTLDQQVAQLTDRIRPLVRFIPNVVNPFIRELVESVSEGLQQVTPDSLIGKKIEVLRFPRFLSSVEFATRLSTYGNRSYSLKTKLGAGIPHLTKEDILERMKTGLTTVDGEIRAWLQAEGTEPLVQLVQNVFGQSPAIYEQDNGLQYLFSNAKTGVYNALVVFILAGNFLKDIPEGTRMAPGLYKDQLEILKGISGHTLYRTLKTMLKKKEDGFLVDRYEADTVYVYEDTYDQFLNQGGTNEQLLGAYMSNNRAYRISAILENAQDYTRNWQQALVGIRTVERDRRALIQERLFNEHFHRIVSASFSESELAKVEVDIAAMCRVFAKTYKELHPAEKEDLAIAATKAVCAARFPASPAKDILLNTRAVLKDNPDLSPESASGMAFAIYISDWIAGLVRFDGVA